MKSKRDNRGFSLVEMIIIIAIMAALTGVLSYGISMISGKPADQCASKLRTVIQNCRVTTMGRTGTELLIYKAADDKIMVKQTTDKGKPTETVKESVVGEKGVNVEFKVTDDATYRSLPNEANALKIVFDRSSGAFKTLDSMGSEFVNKYCVEIKVSKANKTRILEFASLTGKVSLR